MTACTIREARLPDAAGITRLAGQLGYPVAVEVMAARLGRLLTEPGNLVLVAESEGAIAGWAHGFLSQLLESDFRVEVGGLVVDDGRRREGIGRGLLSRLEHWAAEQGAREISLRCRADRMEAHKFYESCGYRPAKTQTAFRKPLALPEE